MIQLVKRLGTERWFAIGNVVVALVIGLGAFGALPVRPTWVGVAAVVLIVALASSSVVLLRRGRSVWFDRITKVAGASLLAAGVAVTGTITLALTFARAVAGAGAGPGRLFFAVALLVVAPYMVIYPAGLLLWLGSRGRPQ